MFGMLENLTKAVVAVAITPVTLVVDVLSIPADSENNKDVFNRTAKMLNTAGENVTKAVNGD